VYTCGVKERKTKGAGSAEAEMAMLKRAAKQLKAAGIEHIGIRKGIHGYVPSDFRLMSQESKCFKTQKEAIEAVISGYRPKEWKKETIL
jgi:hypothetical protein